MAMLLDRNSLKFTKSQRTAPGYSGNVNQRQAPGTRRARRKLS
jgi:hypothetical protein